MLSTAAKRPRTEEMNGESNDYSEVSWLVLYRCTVSHSRAVTRALTTLSYSPPPQNLSWQGPQCHHCLETPAALHHTANYEFMDRECICV